MAERLDETPNELRAILDNLAYKHSCEGYIKNGDPHDIGVIPDEVTNAERLIEALTANKIMEADRKAMFREAMHRATDALDRLFALNSVLAADFVKEYIKYAAAGVDVTDKLYKLKKELGIV